MPDSKGASALDAGHQEDTEPLYLPAPEEGATAVLDVSTGATVKLDHLGPLVGTLTLQRSLVRSALATLCQAPTTPCTNLPVIAIQ